MADIAQSTQRIFIFGEFKIDLSKERIYKCDVEIKLEPQLFSCLTLLVSHSPNVVSRTQIQNEVWAGRHVSDEAVRAAFKKLRKILGDDAKSPVFIKTVPRQGYKFIADIQRIKNSDIQNNVAMAEEKKQNTLKPHYIIAALILCMSVFFLVYFNHTQVNEKPKTPQFRVSKITELAGSETYGSFNHQTQKISFTHRSKSDAAQQIIIKNLKNNQLQKITWDGAHYSGAYWSNGGNKLAFGRGHNGSFNNLISEFNELGDVVDVKALTHEKLKGKYIVGWHGDNALYLAQEAHVSNNRSIYKFNLKTEELIAVTSPQVTGSGDYLASESFNGKYLAIIREVAKGEFSLLILETTSGSLIANRIVPMFVNRIVWHLDNNTLTLSAFSGAAATFNIAKNSLTNLPEFPAYTNDIFAECGKNCYLMRQHNGNYLDIKEAPNSFLSNQTPIEQPLISANNIIALPGAQDFPRYNQSGTALYFATLTADALMIHKQVIGGNLTIKACWPSNVNMTNLEISPNETHFAALINQRLVIEPIKTLSECNLNSQSQPNYMTDSLIKIAAPTWHNDSQSLYLTVYENGKPNIKHFTLKNEKYSPVINDYIAYRPFLRVEGYNAVAIDKNNVAWLISSKKSEVIKKDKLTKIEAANLHRWSVDKSGFYFTSRQGRESFLNRVSFESLSALKTGVNHDLLSISIGNNKFRLGFDLHPNKNKLLLVESLSAQSDFVKVTW